MGRSGLGGCLRRSGDGVNPGRRRASGARGAAFAAHQPTPPSGGFARARPRHPDGPNRFPVRPRRPGTARPMRTLREYDRPVALIAPSGRTWLRRCGRMLAIGADATAVMLASIAAGVGYHAAVYGTSGPPGGIRSARRGVGLAVRRAEHVERGDRFERYRSLGRHPRRVAHRWAVACALTLAFAFLTRSSEVSSRGWLLLFFAGGFVAVCLGRAGPILLMRAAQNAGLVAPRRVVLVGAERDLFAFMRHYQPSAHGLEVVGLPVDAREARRRRRGRTGRGAAGRDRQGARARPRRYRHRDAMVRPRRSSGASTNS